MPSHIFKEVFPALSSVVTAIINSSLTNGIVPSSFKHAIAQPLLKKHHLDQYVLDNYRPISKLSFISKVLEKVTNDILLSLDSGSCCILIMLDLSAAFDTIDHDILLQRLYQVVSFQGSVLNWFASYLKDRSFSVNLGNCFSSRAQISYGVPQGSILGPLLFSLYMLPLGYIFQKHNLSYHLYADDTQFYFPVKNNNCSMSTLFAYIQDIKCWLDLDFLQLNNDKTEIIVFGPTAVSSGLIKQLGPLSAYVRNHIRNLGVVFDPMLSFDKQISTVVKSSFFN